MIRYVSVCSGIEAATVAWHPLGWNPLLFAEIAKFPSQVLAHHYPGVRNVGDFTTITQETITRVHGPETACDLLVGGTPCQAFSVAGLGEGLSDARGNLALEFMRLADRLRPRWVLWENVPGVLSNDDGRAFGSILGALAKLGYGWAYRVVDAQFFGVAQRRRRVFVVGYLGDWRRAAAVLFERESLRRDTPKSRETRAEVARAAESSARVRRGKVIAIQSTLTARDQHAVVIPFDLTRTARPPTIAFHLRQTPISEEEEALPLEAGGPCGIAVYGGGLSRTERDRALSHDARRRSL